MPLHHSGAILSVLAHANSILLSITTTLVRPLQNLLLSPSVRYAYLPPLCGLFNYDRKEAMLHTCFQYLDIAGVKGDYAEFGLWKGANLVRAYHLARRFESCSAMRFHGFDSFEGIPPLTRNLSEAEQFPPGAFAGTYDEVERTLRKGSVDPSKVSLVKGWFSKSLTEETRTNLKLDSIAMAYIDCDVYESTVPVLEFIGPCLREGSVVIFDDWYCFKNKNDRGQQKAFAEWLKRHPEWSATPFKEFGADGKSFLMNHAVGARVERSA